MGGSRESISFFAFHSRRQEKELTFRFAFRRMAATVFQTFVASDDASTTLLQLKRLHGLMPYFVLKGILRVSNPMAMIRGESGRVSPPFPFLLGADSLFSILFASGVLELFLARPFGGQSLVQRSVLPSLLRNERELELTRLLVSFLTACSRRHSTRIFERSKNRSRSSVRRSEIPTSARRSRCS